MPHVYPVYINRVQEHLAERTKFKKRNHETTQVIKNGFLFTLDFLGSTYLLNHRTKNHVTSQGPLGTPFFYASPKSIYLSSSYPPTKPSCISLFYCLSKFYIPYPSLIYTLSIQYYYHVMTPSTSSQTISFTSCNFWQEHPYHISTTATSSYDSLNSSDFLLIISSQIHSLVVDSQYLKTAFCIIHFILSSWQINQVNSSSLSEVNTKTRHPCNFSAPFHYLCPILPQSTETLPQLNTSHALYQFPYHVQITWSETTSTGYT